MKKIISLSVLASVLLVFGGCSQNSTSKDNSSVSSSSKTSISKSNKVPGDEGLYTVSKNMRGKWYSYDKDRRSQQSTNHLSILKIGAHTINGVELHNVNKEFFEKNPELDQDYFNKTKNWRKVIDGNQIKGVNYLDVMAWTKNKDVKNVYGLSHINGYPIIIWGSGEKALTNKVYWQSEQLAKEHADESFHQLVVENE